MTDIKIEVTDEDFASSIEALLIVGDIDDSPEIRSRLKEFPVSWERLMRSLEAAVIDSYEGDTRMCTISRWNLKRLLKERKPCQ